MLLSVTNTVVTPAVGPMISRGNLVYKFVKVLAQIPILMKKLDDPVPKVKNRVSIILKTCSKFFFFLTLS